MNEIDDILLKQKEFAKHFINQFSSLGLKREDTIKFCLSIIKESTELLDEVDYKNIYWNTDKKDVFKYKIEEEIIDLFIFVLDLFILWNIDGDRVIELFEKKLEKNKLKYIKNIS